MGFSLVIGTVLRRQTDVDSPGKTANGLFVEFVKGAYGPQGLRGRIAKGLAYQQYSTRVDGRWKAARALGAAASEKASWERTPVPPAPPVGTRATCRGWRTRPRAT